MLTLYHNGQQHPIQNTEYYIRQLANGLDEVIFNISIWDPIYAIITEEETIQDRGGQSYLVKQIDAGGQTAKIVCQLDVDAWKATATVNYKLENATVAQQINAIKPTGWTVTDLSGNIDQKTIKGNVTPYDVCLLCKDTYDVYIRWDNANKVCTIDSKALKAPVGAFATRELNLKEINYKGKSNDIITRLYAYGKDGLTFADINDGKEYVDNNTYTSRIICAVWTDERYTIAQNLLDDARAKLAKMAMPSRSYNCSIVDLKAVDPTTYSNLGFELYSTATLIDDVKQTSVNYQVVERDIYPYHPDRNNIIFDNPPEKITEEIKEAIDEINDPDSPLYENVQSKIDEAVDGIENQLDGKQNFIDTDILTPPTWDGQEGDIVLSITNNPRHVYRYENTGQQSEWVEVNFDNRITFTDTDNIIPGQTPLASGNIIFVYEPV